MGVEVVVEEDVVIHVMGGCEESCVGQCARTCAGRCEGSCGHGCAGRAH